MLWIFIVVLLLLRLATLGFTPLFDSTEGRYAEIGRKMARSGDWVTPRLDGDTPFLGKPPLHFWMTAASFKTFGTNEFAARLPGYLSLLLMLALTALLARRLYGPRVAAWAALALTSSALVFIGAACVLTDMTLAATVTGAMAGLILALEPGPGRASRSWGYLFFAFLGLGVLAKGPVAVALCVLAVVPPLWFAGRLRALGRLPWIGGLALATLIALPWFILAELRNPGFLKYFILNEHFLRFVKHDFGEQSGLRGHTFFYGSIWWMGVAALLPWSPLLLRAAWRGARDWRTLAGRGPLALLLGWALAPLVLFTPARNIMMTYILPGMPAMAILAGWLLAGQAGLDPAAAPEAPRAAPVPFFPDLSQWLRATVWAGLAGGIVMLVYLTAQAQLPLAALIAGVIPIAMGMRALIVRGSRATRQGLALGAALVFPCCGLFFSLLLGDVIGSSHSTRALVAAIRRDPRLAGRAVAFYGRVPYSAQFYLAQDVPDLRKSQTAARDLIQRNGLLIVPDVDASRVPPELKALLKPALTMKNYRIWVPDNPAGGTAGNQK